jgi:hypothetical protein
VKDLAPDKIVVGGENKDLIIPSKPEEIEANIGR